MDLKDLSFGLRFYYELEKDMDEEVLFMEKIVANNGSSTIAFSFYPSNFQVASIEPKKALKITKTMDGRGAPSAPLPEDIIRLAPGETFKHASWFWADGTFPFHSKGKQSPDIQIYKIPDQTKVTVSLCVDLIGSSGGLEKFLKPGEKLLEGSLCSGKATFLYKVLQKQEE